MNWSPRIEPDAQPLAVRVYWVATERSKAFAVDFSRRSIRSALPAIAGETRSRRRPVRTRGRVAGAHRSGDRSRACRFARGCKSGYRPRAAASGKQRLGAPRAIYRCSSIRRRMVRPALAGAHPANSRSEVRSEIQPVTSAQFMRWLLRWQHVADRRASSSASAARSKRSGSCRDSKRPATAWERQILPQSHRRVRSQNSGPLCLTGVVGWGRLSPHPATLEDADAERHRLPPCGAHQRCSNHFFRQRRRRLDDFAA